MTFPTCHIIHFIGHTIDAVDSGWSVVQMRAYEDDLGAVLCSGAECDATDN